MDHEQFLESRYSMNPTSYPLWTLKHVTLAGGRRPRLDGISLEIPPGVTAVLGASGAGKSSLLGLLSAFEFPDSGRLEFNPPELGEQLPLYWSPQDHGFWPHLTVSEHISQVIPGNPRSRRTSREWLELFGLDGLTDSRPDTLSQGERSRLSLARALVSEAAVIVLDEPLVHVDPMLANDCWKTIADHARKHCTALVFSSHDPDPVLCYADFAICLDRGHVEFCGPVKELYFNPPTRELAWLLGPCNWMPDVGQTIVGSSNGDSPRCVRPDELHVQSDANARSVVTSARRGAGFTEFTLQNLDTLADFTAVSSCDTEPIVEGMAVQLAFVPSPRRTGSEDS